MMRWILALALGALSACATPIAGAPPTCAAPAQELAVAHMYFGRNIGGEVGVSEEQFTAFVDDVVTPRFPNGLTITDALGQWNGRTGIVREPSKVITVFLDAQSEAAGRARLSEIADIYNERFHQEAVALVVERSCVSFE